MLNVLDVLGCGCLNGRRCLYLCGEGLGFCCLYRMEIYMGVEDLLRVERV